MPAVARYRSLPKHQRVLWILGPVALVVAIGIATWWALAASVDKPMWTNIAFDVPDDRTVAVTYQLTRPVDRTTVCSVVAKEMSHATVGRIDDVIEPGGEASMTRTVHVQTTAQAVMGEVSRCRSM